ncbi:hypothetical protein CLV40_104384 [Actinokineospora auranticolor]|uniref:Uncharacterized protein n=1 Tax=Actinokineospora auranticolor TaxID=155976 RepID=A0A2S6GVA7_9PSEU|nr:hypothetical protein CLV40_104384 [Actinokineospora auranticolor]
MARTRPHRLRPHRPRPRPVLRVAAARQTRRGTANSIMLQRPRGVPSLGEPLISSVEVRAGAREWSGRTGGQLRPMWTSPLPGEPSKIHNGGSEEPVGDRPLDLTRGVRESQDQVPRQRQYGNRPARAEAEPRGRCGSGDLGRAATNAACHSTAPGRPRRCGETAWVPARQSGCESPAAKRPRRISPAQAASNADCHSTAPGRPRQCHGTAWVPAHQSRCESPAAKRPRRISPAQAVTNADCHSPAPGWPGRCGGTAWVDRVDAGRTVSTRRGQRRWWTPVRPGARMVVGVDRDAVEGVTQQAGRARRLRWRLVGPGVPCGVGTRWRPRA